jgi:phytoene desaturase
VTLVASTVDIVRRAGSRLLPSAPRSNRFPVTRGGADVCDVVVIGAGIGGLAAALRLAHSGARVRVLEKEPEVGGRCNRLEAGPYRWDIGPTILLFPHVLRELFDDVGARIEDYLELSPCDPNYRMHFADGSTLTTSANLRALQAELERLAPGSFEGYMRVLGLAQEWKRTAFSTFLSRTFDSPAEMLSPSALSGVWRTRSFRSVWSVVSEHVKDERVRRALTFQTMYLGLSPFDGPALFGLLPYTEVVDGIWYPKGGLSAIPRALARLCEERGVRIECGRQVAAIEKEGTRVQGVRLADGERVLADVVLCNADLPYACRALLGEPLRRNMRYTSSAYMMFLGCARRWPELSHHNAFFGKPYRTSFTDIFERGVVPEDPAFYVADAATSDPAVAPEGHSALYVLVPVPHLPKPSQSRAASEPWPVLDWHGPELRRRLREHVIGRLESSVAPGLSKSIVMERDMTPLDWASRFSLDFGSAFGLAHTLDQVGAFRPSPRHGRYGNLYFVGASTQPATGIPNVLMGARHVAARIVTETTSLARAPSAARAVP